jgi:hypothetical protein
VLMLELAVTILRNRPTGSCSSTVTTLLHTVQ